MKTFAAILLAAALTTGCASVDKPGENSVAPPASSGQTRGGFYNVAHMANAPFVVDWAVGQGANAVEVDLNFTDRGNLEGFCHGTPCECMAPHVEGICSVATCETRSSVDELVRHIAIKQTGVALVIIDAKADQLQSNNLTHAGNQLANEVIRALYRIGYDGNVVLSVPRLCHLPMLEAAFKTTRDQAPGILPKVRFAIDGEGHAADEVIRVLSGITSQIAYGTGISAMLSGDFRDAIDVARSRSVPFTYIWTIDRKSSMNRYIDRGVNAIITNRPDRLKQIIEQRGLRLARRGDGFTGP